jgi:ATP-dependent Clp protease ATP-binding subunit ClpA
MGKTPDEIYALVREYLRYNVKAYFYCGLGRPELYGRIEDSLVYYNYIGKAAVGNIVASKIKSASKAAIAAMGVESVECGDDVRSAINDYCQSCNVRALGARGILKSTDKLFTGSLSNFLSDYIRGADGKSRQDLVGRTVACTCQGSINSANDITWSVR